MEMPIHSLTSLFEQLGLDSSNEAITTFINTHKPIAADIALSDADFWNPSQASFLKQTVDEDADWAEVVDQLDAMLR